ncbi:glycosyltransferase [candidate division KSB1 bacterium]|nr:glycosyltransferase [candidate division KSB1 bacterium]RQW01922.1 MAG: glycosyltransferase [candidate division KSB1 bacterium]
MKILMVHKFYYVEGGAERYVFNVTDLMKEKGHTVIPFAMRDDRNFSSDYSRFFADPFGPEQLFATHDPFKRLRIARDVIFNRHAQARLASLIEETKPDIAHVHSVYHHLSPSVLFTLKKYNLPVMLTLHDYKIVCPNYIFLDGARQVCEECRGRHFWKATAKKCFRNSYAASALVTAEAYWNYWKKSYLKNVDLFVSPSRFLADKVCQYGYQKKHVKVQPYTLDLRLYEPCHAASDYFVFMGRLTHEKGVHFLLDAAKKIRGADLLILGAGPIENELRQRVLKENLRHVKMVGYQSGAALRDLVRQAKFTVVTSEWYDNSPLVIYESLALGNPVIAARMGGIPELIEEGLDGFVYDRGDLESFVAFANYLIQNPKRAREMGINARQKAERLYGFDQHYEKLLDLYNHTSAVASKNSRLPKDDLPLR